MNGVDHVSIKLYLLVLKCKFHKIFMCHELLLLFFCFCFQTNLKMLKLLIACGQHKVGVRLRLGPGTIQKCTATLMMAAAAAKPSAERWEAAGTELRLPPGMHLNLTRWPRGTVCLLTEKQRAASGHPTRKWERPDLKWVVWACSLICNAAPTAFALRWTTRVFSLPLEATPRGPSHHPWRHQIFRSPDASSSPLPTRSLLPSHFACLPLPWTLQVYFWFRILTCNAPPHLQCSSLLTWPGKCLWVWACVTVLERPHISPVIVSLPEPLRLAAVFLTTGSWLHSSLLISCPSSHQLVIPQCIMGKHSSWTHLAYIFFFFFLSGSCVRAQLLQ